MKKVQLTQQEWWDAQRLIIYKNKKKYTRKTWKTQTVLH